MAKNGLLFNLGGGGTLKAQYNWVLWVKDKISCPPLVGGPKSMISRWGKKLDCFAPARNDGFTLAEILITLGIIGVVAAMTIPNLMSNWQEKRTVNLLKETHSILAQALRLAEEEYGDVPSWGLNGITVESSELIVNNLRPFIKIATDCGGVDVSGKCIYKSSYKTLDEINTYNYYHANQYYKLTLINGVSLIIRGNADVSDQIFIFADINGPHQPNVWGRDMFGFFYKENKFVPMGAPDSPWPNSSTCTLTSTGFGCAYYVLHFGNMDYLHK